MEYNVYCDESCHLENDGFPNMVIGGIYIDKDRKKEICNRIADIKKDFNVLKTTEVKWTKVSNNKLDMYKTLINYFFDDDDLHFRCIVANKENLDHARYHQTHDEWYYKIYWDMMKGIISPRNSFNFYIDTKDSYSHLKAKKLEDILANSQLDFSKKIIKKVQPIKSDEVQIMQLVDLLIGAIKTANQGNLPRSSAKLEIIKLIKNRSSYSLKKSTLLSENKLNIFKWVPNYYE